MLTIRKDVKSATLTIKQPLLSQSAPASPPAAGQMPTVVAMIPQPGAGKASRAHSRGVIQRNPKAVAAAASTPSPTPSPSSNLEPPSPEQLEQQATAAAAQLQLQQQQQPRIKQPGEP